MFRSPPRRSVPSGLSGPSDPQSVHDQRQDPRRPCPGVITRRVDPEDPTPIRYRRSKTPAEPAAWEFIRGHDGPTELTTVLPGAVFGPVLTTDTAGSVGIVARMPSGAMPGCRGSGRTARQTVPDSAESLLAHGAVRVPAAAQRP
ncbi:hypothetical protein [Streptomyces sp. GbtcB6]|uniref:hypothetical protein n=1 Tax=Streptomyces sp. GbtcB6 TaxID=2824751 RepID=UPI0020C61AD5|nr:hypothetical protein [Streptomyces sp. GbtcB6]